MVMAASAFLDTHGHDKKRIFAERFLAVAS
jgi:hypothetical protein